MKLKPISTTAGNPYGWSHWCPGCNDSHVIPTSTVLGDKAWGFNGDVERPTFTPSVLNTWKNEAEGLSFCCHYVITAGSIQFCGDCTHALAGQTVPLPELP